MKFSKFNLKIEKEDGSIILFNTLTGNCISIDAETAICVERGDINALDVSQINMLIGLGFIVGAKTDENVIVKYYRDKEKYASDVVSSTVLLSWACNLKCV